MNARPATHAEEDALLAFMHDYEPIHSAVRCAGGCGRQVPQVGALCIRCANKRPSKSGARS